MLFIPITLVGAASQVARNALQRGLMDEAGPWGATLVRFAFGLPFAIAFVAIAWRVWPAASPLFSPLFWIVTAAGAAAQVGATAALLLAMKRSGFAIGATLQTSSLPFSTLMGWAFLGDGQSLPALIGIVMASAGLIALSWPRKVQPGGWPGAVLGLISGATFAVALNAYRAAAVAVEPDYPIFAAVLTASVAMAGQTLLLGGLLALFDRRALKALASGWKASVGAGFFGALASAGWISALALAPAAAVRAVGVVELPLSALAGRRLFAERLSLIQIAWGLVTAMGVALAALS